MSEWNVIVQVATDEHLDEDTLFELAQHAETWDATVSARGDAGPGYMLNIDVQTFTPHHAGDEAYDIALKLATTAELVGEVVALEVRTPELAELAAYQPDTPELLAPIDIAEVLGVSRQRVHQLAAEHPDFPKPYQRLGTGPIWTRPAVEAFDRRWTRKPGRRAPRKVTSV